MTPTDSPSPAPRPVKPRKPAARRRWLPWLGAILLVAAIALGLRPKPIPVEIGRVSEGTLRATINEEGRTRIRQRYTVYAPVAGQLRRLPFKAGASVRAGETVVAVLDPLPSSLLDARSRILAEARRDTAAAQLAKAREALRFAALELQRFQKLYADRTVSAQELEGVQWREAAATKEATAAESALRQAEAELAEFEANPTSVAAGVPPAVEGGVPPPGVLDSVMPDHPHLPPGKMPGSTAGGTPAATNSDVPPPGVLASAAPDQPKLPPGKMPGSTAGETPAATNSDVSPPKGRPSTNPPVEVRAPISGQVLRVPEESARVVTPGTPLLEIGDPTDLEVVIEVLSRDGAAIRPGAVVELHHWGGETPLEARVRLVEPAAFTKVSALGVEEQRVNVIADLVTPPDQRPGLGDRFRVEARIVVWESPRTLKAPTGGVFRKGADWAAFTLRDGKTVLQPVQVGRSSGTEVQILEGLKADEEIVLYPGDRIRESIRVRPVVISP